MPDVGRPPAAVFDLRPLRDGVAELDAGGAVQAVVGLFVPGCGGVGVWWDGGGGGGGEARGVVAGWAGCEGRGRGEEAGGGVEEGGWEEAWPEGHWWLWLC